MSEQLEELTRDARTRIAEATELAALESLQSVPGVTPCGGLSAPQSSSSESFMQAWDGCTVRWLNPSVNCSYNVILFSTHDYKFQINQQKPCG